MREISPKELNSDFDATLKACSSTNLNTPDDVLGRNIFEDFDVGVMSFLHQSSLERLQSAGYIDQNIKELSIDLREKALFALQNYRSVAAVRGNDCWAAIMEMSDRIIRLKATHDQVRPR